MIDIGGLSLGPVPRIAAPLTDEDVRAHAGDVGRWADLVELRIDHFTRRDPAHVAQVCRDARALGLPLIATIRDATEGGGVALADAERLALFEAVLPLVAAIDIELRAVIGPSVIGRARKAGARTIVSWHDFAATPPPAELAAFYRDADATGADIVKVAVSAHSMADTVGLLEFLLAHRARGLIVIAMGPHGAASRVFFPLLGSLISYGSVGVASAPGQLPLAELHRELRQFSPEFAAAHAE